MTLSAKAQAFCVENLLKPSVSRNSSDSPQNLATSCKEDILCVRIPKVVEDSLRDAEEEERYNAVREKGVEAGTEENRDDRCFESKHLEQKAEDKECVSPAAPHRPAYCFCHGDISFCHHSGILSVPDENGLAKSIVVELCHADLWASFHRLGTEMIITKSGRRMFPSLKLRVSGLNPDKLYSLKLEFLQPDTRKHRYIYHSSRWIVSGSGDALPSPPVHVTPDGPISGQAICSQIVSFERLKLTNSDAGKPGQVSLASMQKFQPQVRIEEVCVEGQEEGKKTESYSILFPQTSFMAVTAYQNQQITTLKIASNPFAKGFRESGKARIPYDAFMAPYPKFLYGNVGLTYFQAPLKPPIDLRYLSEEKEIQLSTSGKRLAYSDEEDATELGKPSKLLKLDDHQRYLSHSVKQVSSPPSPGSLMPVPSSQTILSATAPPSLFLHPYSPYHLSPQPTTLLPVPPAHPYHPHHHHHHHHHLQQAHTVQMAGPFPPPAHLPLRPMSQNSREASSMRVVNPYINLHCEGTQGVRYAQNLHERRFESLTSKPVEDSLCAEVKDYRYDASPSERGSPSSHSAKSLSSPSSSDQSPTTTHPSSSKSGRESSPDSSPPFSYSPFPLKRCKTEPPEDGNDSSAPCACQDCESSTPLAWTSNSGTPPLSAKPWAARSKFAPDQKYYILPNSLENKNISWKVQCQDLRSECS
ncbi:T-box transcription factor TBX20 [Aplysia californica]|uniref:T-box transcription factor TBX20 n=1 Tax=Aplysia californica TaxID=6500 RepID=A0ABM0ZVZ5_APLCA|nr:T-box transcription factor TBX20 [Aplysia californica]